MEEWPVLVITMAALQLVALLLPVITSVLCVDPPAGYEEKCQKQHNINAGDFQILQNAMVPTDDSNEDQRCFITCLLTAEGMFKNGGELDVDYFIQESQANLSELDQKLDEPKFRKQLETCAKKSGEGNCATQVEIWKCVLDDLTRGLPTV